MTDFVTTTNEDRAVQIMRSRNRAAAATGRDEWFVLVDGPGDGEFTVMPLDEAVDSEFLYRWKV